MTPTPDQTSKTCKILGLLLFPLLNPYIANALYFGLEQNPWGHRYRSGTMLEIKLEKIFFWSPLPDMTIKWDGAKGLIYMSATLVLVNTLLLLAWHLSQGRRNEGFGFVRYSTSSSTAFFMIIILQCFIVREDKNRFLKYLFREFTHEVDIWLWLASFLAAGITSGYLARYAARRKKRWSSPTRY